MWQELLQQLKQGNQKSLARTITLVENRVDGYKDLLKQLQINATNIVGITGPPGAGKSTLVDALIDEWVKQNKKIGILCVDPSSPFNSGALLGDRIRMSEWYNHPAVFIRSLAARGSLGGLNPAIIEITDIMKAAGFDLIIIETVGVGQSEIDIAGLADTTVVVLVPEAGDEVQAMKSGVMEIADIFVVNKSDRPGADLFIKNLRMMLPHSSDKTNSEIPVIKTIASSKKGIEELAEKILLQQQMQKNAEKKYWLIAEKIYQLIRDERMKNIVKSELTKLIHDQYQTPGFNLYQFAEEYNKKNN